MARPSPRTEGVDEEGNTFKMFGTQQLKFVDPAQPASGVKQIDVGKSFRQLTTSIGFDFGTPTTPNVFTPTRPQTTNGNGTGCECEACKNGTGVCSDKRSCCDAWDIPCELFGCPQPKSCECEACKNGTGDCSDKVPVCDAWDIGCEITGGKPLIPEDTFFWIKVILAIIGIGVLLWLLRPLFGMIGAFKGGAP